MHDGNIGFVKVKVVSIKNNSIKKNPTLSEWDLIKRNLFKPAWLPGFLYTFLMFEEMQLQQHHQPCGDRNSW